MRKTNCIFYLMALLFSRPCREVLQFLAAVRIAAIEGARRVREQEVRAAAAAEAVREAREQEQQQVAAAAAEQERRLAVERATELVRDQAAAVPAAQEGDRLVPATAAATAAAVVRARELETINEEPFAQYEVEAAQDQRWVQAGQRLEAAIARTSRRQTESQVRCH